MKIFLLYCLKKSNMFYKHSYQSNLIYDVEHIALDLDNTHLRNYISFSVLKCILKCRMDKSGQSR